MRLSFKATLGIGAILVSITTFDVGNAASSVPPKCKYGEKPPCHATPQRFPSGAKRQPAQSNPGVKAVPRSRQQSGAR